MNDRYYTTIERILVDTFGVPADDVRPEATFESLELDSLDLVELLLAVEDETGVHVEDDELEGVRTVGDAARLVAAKAKVSA